jgi:hypothetical protein
MSDEKYIMQFSLTSCHFLLALFQAYMVFKGHGKSEESSGVIPKPQAAKFLSKPRSGNSQCVPSTNSSTAGIQEYAKLTEMDVQVHQPNNAYRVTEMNAYVRQPNSSSEFTNMGVEGRYRNGVTFALSRQLCRQISVLLYCLFLGSTAQI